MEYHIKKTKKREQNKKVGMGLDTSRIDEDDEEYKSDSSEELKKKPFGFRNRKMSTNSYHSLDKDHDTNNAIDYLIIGSDNNS